MAGACRRPEAERFLSHVIHDPSGCWIWGAYRMKNGYGHFRTPRGHELAHRASYRLFCGELDGKYVLHSCDNPSCVNPEHLSLGTQRDNMQDAKAKRRNASGERHGKAKLTKENAFAIKHASGTQRSIAEKFGVSQTCVWEIKSGRKWAPSLSSL